MRMANHVHRKKRLVLFLLFMFVLPEGIYAYLDPSILYYFISLIVGVIVAVLFYIKTIWIRIKNLLSTIIDWRRMN